MSNQGLAIDSLPKPRQTVRYGCTTMPKGSDFTLPSSHCLFNMKVGGRSKMYKAVDTEANMKKGVRLFEKETGRTFKITEDDVYYYFTRVS